MASSLSVRTAGIGYSLSWVVGLSVFSASTDVHSGGREIQSTFAGHGAAVGAQYVFTEGRDCADIDGLLRGAVCLARSPSAALPSAGSARMSAIGR
jgi:hypothetical protein